MQLVNVMRDVFNNPPIPHEPSKQSLKAWAMYCLRSRGFVVVYAQNADFAIEARGGEKTYVKVATSPAEPTGTCIWIVWDSATGTTQVLEPQS